ncbi:MAG TPA: metalloprotease PmbA [Stenotrophobium sp.]|jgi:PmbA protein|nr:metalloprotease PmbA [Stenotrophobium sp.]
MQNPPDNSLPSAADLEPRAALALETARTAGATQTETSLSVSRGLSVSVRKGEVESVEFQYDRSLGITVYFNGRKGNATTADLSDAGIRQAVQAACAIAAATGEDACNGLADARLLAREFPDLDLDHAWNLPPDAAVELARECEAAALAVDPRITQSEGGSVSTHRGISVYANSHGFCATRRGSNHSLSCAVVATQGQEMQRDYWYSSARSPADLLGAQAIGRKAGERSIARLGARKLGTRQAPVLFVPELARGLFSHFIGAISGAALYRKASFLLDKLDQPVFSPQVTLTQNPFIPRGAGSSAYDSEGVATCERTLVDAGVLKGWLLGSYSARKLKLETTGNAGGVFNLVARPGKKGFDELLREMGSGLVVTELMGQGVNGVTGDYSRGAAGYWVENGTLAYPVQELTIAGNLLDMFRGVQAVGSDVDPHANIRTGSVLIDRMTIAGE